jgi:hypothetical protein
MALFRRKADETVAAGGVRRGLQSGFNRLVATVGIVGIGTALAAILGTQDVDAWIVGLVTAILSVILASIVWSTRIL